MSVIPGASRIGQRPHTIERYVMSRSSLIPNPPPEGAHRVRIGLPSHTE
jgi:hypothetical protein